MKVQGQRYRLANDSAMDDRNAVVIGLVPGLVAGRNKKQLRILPLCIVKVSRALAFYAFPFCVSLRPVAPFPLLSSSRLVAALTCATYLL